MSTSKSKRSATNLNNSTTSTPIKPNPKQAKMQDTMIIITNNYLLSSMNEKLKKLDKLDTLDLVPDLSTTTTGP
jgi:hypothetical protein